MLYICFIKENDMEKYLIQSLNTLGYWSTSYDGFKGILFAKRYKSYEEAKEAAIAIVKKHKGLSINYTLTIISIIES
jgi:hypothetical protein